jgi:hypothetical protein
VVVRKSGGGLALSLFFLLHPADSRLALPVNEDRLVTVIFAEAFRISDLGYFFFLETQLCAPVS